MLKFLSALSITALACGGVENVDTTGTVHGCGSGFEFCGYGQACVTRSSVTWFIIPIYSESSKCEDWAAQSMPVRYSPYWVATASREYLSRDEYKALAPDKKFRDLDGVPVDFDPWWLAQGRFLTERNLPPVGK